MVKKDRLVGRYVLGEVLGAGGMGVVHRAFDVRLGREVAAKVVDLSAASEAERVRFEREALAMGRLRSAHIATLHDVGEDVVEGSRCGFLVMELLEGVPLHAVLRDGLPTVADVVAWGRQMCCGLRDAHAAGVVHRDVKPSNVMLSPRGTVTFVDFGIAQLHADAETVTCPGTVVGTPAYMAPERLLGETVDGRCDLYSLGCVLYELLVGAPPFGQGVARSKGAQPVPLRTVRPDVSAELEALVQELLCAEPAGRPDAIEAECRLAAVAAATRPEVLATSDVALWAAPTRTVTRHMTSPVPAVRPGPPTRSAPVGQSERVLAALACREGVRGSAGWAVLAGAGGVWAQLSLFTGLPGWAAAGVSAVVGLVLWALCVAPAEPDSGSAGNVLAALAATVVLSGHLAGWTTVPWWGVLVVAVLLSPALLGVSALVATVTTTLTGGDRSGVDSGVTAGLVNATALMMLLENQVPAAATLLAGAGIWLAIAFACVVAQWPGSTFAGRHR